MSEAIVPTTEPATSGAAPVSVVDQVQRVRAVFDSGRTRDLGWRRRQLEGMVRLLEEGKEDLARAIQADLRRSELEAVMLDLVATRSEAQLAVKQLASWVKPRRVRTPVAALPGRSWVQYEPVGVALVIAPWNYPVHLALAPMVAALAAGNCVVLKPSEITAHVSAVLADLVPRYLDPEAVVVVEGGAEVTQELLAQGFDHCFFTGSPAVGKAVMRAAAEHLTPVTLELGGKCPAVVTASADLAVAARRIAWGKVANSGQTCVSPDYVLVDASVREEFVGELTGALRTFSDGQPLPIVNNRHASRLAGLLGDCGGQVVLGGVVVVEAARAEPTVVLDPDPGSPIMAEEIFGPLLPVVTVASLDQAIAQVQRGSRPLASYLFSADRGQQDHFLREVVTGGVVINHVMLHLSVPELPFGGVGTSGMGRYHGRWGFETFSNAKAVLRKPFRPDPSVIYPPYRGWKKKLLERGM
ncbi:aldehyde dehydrogenase family protein [Klenkia brasiliensis]|uniref:Aldehyde dehydrogenase n=1 Tax=Klenkia brasiliensis TaxID=333142 RepID=A0A1G8ACZ7_9ACTN|nr:aldehyde dehydrogenase family protein [Klenkia brasiliensis]SDH18220.1 aldehyde dehydrogenase (NAD+) [Klenkia brasiliensis]